MSGITITGTLAPRRTRPVAPNAPASPEPRASDARRSDRTARRLALAYHVEALVEEGRLPDYAAAARILGITRARMTQVMNLLLLAPDLQECLLLSTPSVSEHRLRRALRYVDWDAQRLAMGGGHLGHRISGWSARHSG